MSGPHQPPLRGMWCGGVCDYLFKELHAIPFSGQQQLRFCEAADIQSAINRTSVRRTPRQPSGWGPPLGLPHGINARRDATGSPGQGGIIDLGTSQTGKRAKIHGVPASRYVGKGTFEMESSAGRGLKYPPQSGGWADR